MDGNRERSWGDKRIGDDAGKRCNGGGMIKERSYAKVEGDEIRSKGKGNVFLCFRVKESECYSTFSITLLAIRVCFNTRTIVSNSL